MYAVALITYGGTVHCIRELGVVGTNVRPAVTQVPAGRGTRNLVRCIVGACKHRHGCYTILIKEDKWTKAWNVP